MNRRTGEDSPYDWQTWLLGGLWILVLSQVLTLFDNASFVLFERGSTSHVVLALAFVGTSTGLVVRGRWAGWVATTHLAIVVLLILRRPMSVPFERDGFFVLLAAYLIGLMVQRGIRPEIVLLAASTLAGLGILETGLSVVEHEPRGAAGSSGLADYGDLLGRMKTGGMLRPGLNQQMVGANGPVSIVTNSLGFRNREELRRRVPAGTDRILFVGDSFVAGYRVDQDAIIGARLQRELESRRGRAVEVWNAAAGGPDDYHRYVGRYALRFDPALIIVGVTLGNDVGAAYASARGLPLEEGPVADLQLPQDAYRGWLGMLPVRIHRSLHGWRWYGTVDRVLWPEGIGSWHEDIPGRVHLFDGIHGLGLFYVRTPIEPVLEAYRELGSTLKAIDAAVNGSTRILFVLFPQRFQVSHAEWSAALFDYGLDADAFTRDAPNEAIREECRRRRLICVDLLPAFRSEERQLYMPAGDMHWNADGHAVASAALTPRVLRTLEADG